MTYFDKIKSFFSSNLTKYTFSDEAVIVACYFNPTHSEYRLKAFNLWYDSIKHLNHKIVECVIGEGKSELDHINNIKVIRTESLLWHKEGLLNALIKDLDAYGFQKCKYVFWLDTDVVFTNKNWLVEGVRALKTNDIIQPFEYCVHLAKDEIKPSLELDSLKKSVQTGLIVPKQTLWRSFCANYNDRQYLAGSEDYNTHGHVGFAWGARREILEKIPLYDKALIGGADHIMAHAAAKQIPHKCIDKSFTDDLENVYSWSKKFAKEIHSIGYVKGDLYHIWHGDIEKRQYLKRIKEFTVESKEIVDKDASGLYVNKNTKSQRYMKTYFQNREVRNTKVYDDIDRHGGRNNNDTFLQSAVLGYATDSPVLGGLLGGDYLGGIVGAGLRDHSNSDHKKDNSEHKERREHKEAPESYGVHSIQTNHFNESHDYKSPAQTSEDSSPSPFSKEADACINENFS